MNETFYVQGLKTTSTKFVLPISKKFLFPSHKRKQIPYQSQEVHSTHMNLSNARTPQGYLESLQAQATQHGIGMPKTLMDARKTYVRL